MTSGGTETYGIQIHEIWDGRKVIRVGDVVAYPGHPTVELHHAEYADNRTIKVRQHLRFSRVKSMEGDEYGGFAEAGRKITVVLEDGHSTCGDSENGGFNLLKLEQ